MPKKYIDDEGNEVELLTPEEQTAEIKKLAVELAGTKKEELPAPKVEDKKVDETPKTPTLEEIEQIIAPIKQAQEDIGKDWFNTNVNNFIDEKNEEEKKQVDYWFNLLKKQGQTKEQALESAVMLVTKKPLTPLNGVVGYNKNSSVPKSNSNDSELGEIKKLYDKFPAPSWLQKALNKK